MSLGIPAQGDQIQDRGGRVGIPWYGFFQQLVNALILQGTGTPGNIIVFGTGAGTATDGGPVPSGDVTHTGTLTDHAVIVGNGGADISALAALGSAGDVLTSNGAGADPSFQPAASSADAETLAWLGL